MQRAVRPTTCRASVAKDLGLPETAAHPQDATHYLGLYFMASRGAELVDSVEIASGRAAAE